MRAGRLRTRGSSELVSGARDRGSSATIEERLEEKSRRVELHRGPDDFFHLPSLLYR